MIEPVCHCNDVAWGTCPQHGGKKGPILGAPPSSDTPAYTFDPSGAGPVSKSEALELSAGGTSKIQIMAGGYALPESILQEAHRLTHGDRQKAYGHPLDDYTRTAAMVSAMLAHKLKEPLAPHEMALVMVCVKLSRQINAPKRDNMVDGAGYCWVSQECLDEAERRSK